MLKAVAFLLRLGLFTAAVLWLSARPGTVEMTWHGWRVETSAGFMVACLLALLGVYTVLYRLWRGFAGAPRAWRRHRTAQRREQGYRDVTRGFVAIASGDAHGAHKHAARAVVMIPDAPLAKLLSAQTHLLRGDAPKARRLFADLLDDGHAAIFGVRGLLQETLRSGEYREALQHIRRADDLQPKRAWVVKTLFELETRNREWPRAEAALKKGERLGVFTAAEATRHRQALLLARAEEAASKGESVRAPKLAARAFALDPAFTPAATYLAAFYIDAGKKKTALKVIRRAWAANPHPALGQLWMTLAPPPKKEKSPYDAGKAEYAWAKELSDLNPGHTASARLLGAAALEARQWGPAREHLTRASDYRGLAKLERAETGNEAKAREWLEILNDSPPDPAWVCTACGHTDKSWTALCRHCGRFGQAEWMVPEKAAVPPPLLAAEEHGPQGLFTAP